MKMLEKVARALAVSEGFYEEDFGIYLDAAKAAIEAMQESSDEMISVKGYQPRCFTCGGHLEGYKLMIAGALKQDEADETVVYIVLCNGKVDKVFANAPAAELHMKNLVKRWNMVRLFPPRRMELLEVAPAAREGRPNVYRPSGIVSPMILLIEVDNLLRRK